MTINSICIDDYMSGADYLEIIFKMLDNLSIETIQICNTSKLYGMLALCYYMTENEYRSYKCLRKIDILIKHLLEPDDGKTPDFYRWHEDLFLYYLVSGLLSKSNGEYEEALDYFNKAKFHFESNTSTYIYGVVAFTVELFDLYRKMGMDDKAADVLEEGLNICKDNGFMLKQSMINMKISGRGISVRPMNFTADHITLDDLVELSYNVGKENELRERKKDIKFLSSLQEITNKDIMDDEALTRNVLKSIQNNFNLDGILLIAREPDKSKSMAYGGRVDEDNDGIYDEQPVKGNDDEDNIIELYRDGIDDLSMYYKDIFSFFGMMKKEFMISRTDKSFFEFDKVVSLFGKNRVVTFVGVPIIEEKNIKTIFIATVNMHRNFRKNRILLNEEDLSIIKTSVIQLSNGIERIHNKQNIIDINEKLNRLAIHDNLTGLFNRQGMAKCIDEHTNVDGNVAILYADLDNFKYYNDNFGHEVGDLVLIEFAKIFKDVTKDKGFAVRYGGDEFLVIIYDTDKEEVGKVVEDIYYRIREGFVDLVSDNVGEKVSIEKSNLVTCSIGIDIEDNSVL